MQYEEALKIVKKYVKMSAVENQPHIDLTLAEAHERYEVEKALAALKLYVKRGDLTEQALNLELGLKA